MMSHRQRLRSATWTTGERLLAATAHAAIGFGLVGIGFLLSLAINLVIWLMSRHSRHVALHAEQAGLYQLGVLAINVLVVVGWLAASAAIFGRVVLWPPAEPAVLERELMPAAVTLWLLAVPLFVCWYVGSIAYGLLGAVRVLLGREHWYPLAGRWARRKYGPPTASDVR
jgi:hypothetical protein